MGLGGLEPRSRERRSRRFLRAWAFPLVFLSLGLFGLSVPVGAAQGSKWGIGVDGDPAPMVILRAQAGGQPEPVADATTHLTYEAHPAARRTYRIRARLDQPLPPGVTLEVRLGSGTFQILPAYPQEPVTLLEGIPRKARGSLPVVYRLSAHVSAGVVEPLIREVTFYWEEETA